MFGPDDENSEGQYFSNFRRTTSEMQPGAWGKLFAVVAIVAAAVSWMAIQSGRESDEAAADRLVLYCAHDLPFVEELVAEFEASSGIEVTIVADSEANKSLGLTRRIEAERQRPQADVFWNNQLLGTVDLAARGLFQPHADLPERERFPQSCRDAEGLWTAFGARLRVWIMNPEGGFADSAALDTRLPLSKEFCVADPMYGTTLTHAAVLWKQEGSDVFKQWFESLPRKGVRVVPGNSATRDLVADGICGLGWTDTDDYFGAVDRGADVQMTPVLTTDGGTIAIPNSVAIIRNCRHREAARKFVSWVLSEEVELKLANGKAAQVPLGAVSDETHLPARVAGLRDAVGNGIDLRPYVNARREVLDYLSGRAP